MRDLSWALVLLVSLKQPSTMRFFTPPKENSSTKNSSTCKLFRPNLPICILVSKPAAPSSTRVPPCSMQVLSQIRTPLQSTYIIRGPPSQLLTSAFRSMVATATLTNTHAVATGATPSCTTSAEAPRRSASGSLVVN